jgi:enolase
LTGATISAVLGWEALDSRGVPTVACRVLLTDGTSGRAIVPAGASTGRHEAVELRDGGGRYSGLGTKKAVENVSNEFAAAVAGLDPTDQERIDRTLREADGTSDFGRLGANAALAISVAAALAGARSSGMELFQFVSAGEPPLLPLPMVNIISGGAHAARSIDVQDFLAVPLGAASFSEAIEWISRVRSGTAAAMQDLGYSPALVADEGGLSAPLGSNRAALELLARGVERAGLKLGDDIAIAIDVAATQLFENDSYLLAGEGRALSSEEMIDELASWVADFPVVSVEDALAEDDWDGWARATARLGGIQLLGDDLFVTNTSRLQRGISDGVGNAVLVKPNQIGTLSDALNVVQLAHKATFATVLSARSGESEDHWLADLAVGWRTGQFKVGSTMRSERTAKWNRLLELEAMQCDIEYAGRSALGGSGRQAK